MPWPFSSLDAEPLTGHFRTVKTLLLFFFVTLAAFGQQKEALTRVPPRNIVPMDVKQRAQAAVDALMVLTMRGDFKSALDAMNPDYIQVTSRPYGGPVKFKAALLKQMNAMGKNGVKFNAAITQPSDTAFEVDYGFENQLVNGKPVMGKDGKPVQVARYRSWMVFVPTVTEFQYFDKTKVPNVLRKFRKWSFEVAISPKSNEKWTFINGSNINALQLRKIFPFLPREDKDLRFPAKKVEERLEKK